MERVEKVADLLVVSFSSHDLRNATVDDLRRTLRDSGYVLVSRDMLRIGHLSGMLSDVDGEIGTVEEGQNMYTVNSQGEFSNRLVLGDGVKLSDYAGHVLNFLVVGVKH